MKKILERHMPAAQFVFDAICAAIFLGGSVAVYLMISAPWPVLP